MGRRCQVCFKGDVWAMSIEIGISDGVELQSIEIGSKNREDCMDSLVCGVNNSNGGDRPVLE